MKAIKVSLVFVHRRVLLSTIITIALAIGMTDVRSAQGQTSRPCDIFAAATPCVAAFSTTRALFSGYTGSLYRVKRASDNTSTDIGVNSSGIANAASQDSFCSITSCTIIEVYDQTSNHNNLTLAPPGGNGYGAGPGGQDLPVNATALPVTIGGQKVYGMYFDPGMGYRNNSAVGTAVNGQAEGVYMVASGIHVNNGCCFDFGNAETNNDDNGASHMDAINIVCAGSPCLTYITLDLENGGYGDAEFGEGLPFVTDMAWNDGQQYFATYYGDAQSGTLGTAGQTALPSGYSPMHQEGAIILGMGGDNSLSSMGSFFEGVMTIGAPTSSVLSLVQANIVAASYATVSINGSSGNATVIDDTASSISYSGTFGSSSGLDTATWYDGTSHYSNSIGATVQHTCSNCQEILYASTTSPDQGIANFYVDGLLAGSADLYSAGRTTSAVRLGTGLFGSSGTHTLEVEVSGNGNPQASNTYMETDAFQELSAATMIDDPSSSITYRGSWGTATGLDTTKWVGGDSHYSNSQGATASYTCSNCIELLFNATTSPDQGFANVYIDGTLVGSVDEYSSARITSRVRFGTGVLSRGTHTLTIGVSGSKNASSSDTYVEVDALQEVD